MKIGDVPFEDLKIGMNVISCVGTPGTIAGIYPVGDKTFDRHGWDDWGGGLLFIWNNGKWSLAGYSCLEVELVV